jgi:hypothetical protein
VKLPDASTDRFAFEPPVPGSAEEALERAHQALGTARTDGLIAGGGAIFTALGYLGYRIATDGPLEMLIPDRPNLVITALLAALTLGFIGKGAKNLANAARWAVVAGARRIFGASSKGAPLSPAPDESTTGST